MVDPADSLEKLLASAKAENHLASPNEVMRWKGKQSLIFTRLHGHVGGDTSNVGLESRASFLPQAFAFHTHSIHFLINAKPDE